MAGMYVMLPNPRILRDMSSVSDLFSKNRAWSERIRRERPEFFETLSKQQSPKYLWIGCSDSRVPANEIVGLLPGEMFVHRNVANVVVHTDLNCLSVIQYAVDVLRVETIIVVGHYGCGGVKAALDQAKFGLIDNWLRHIQDVAARHAGLIEAAGTPHRRHDLLGELNVVEQVRNVAHTTVVQEAWARGQELEVVGWIYGLTDGLVHDLGINVTSADAVDAAYHNALQTAASRYM